MGCPDSTGSHDQAGSLQSSFLHRLFAGNIQKFLISDTTGGRHTGFKINGHGLNRPECELGDTVLHPMKVIIQPGVQGKMVVTVDEPGKQHLTGAVDYFRIRIHSKIGSFPNSRNFIAFNENRPVFDGRFPQDIDDR